MSTAINANITLVVVDAGVQSKALNLSSGILRRGREIVIKDDSFVPEHNNRIQIVPSILDNVVDQFATGISMSDKGGSATLICTGFNWVTTSRNKGTPFTFRPDMIDGLVFWIDGSDVTAKGSLVQSGTVTNVVQTGIQHTRPYASMLNYMTETNGKTVYSFNSSGFTSFANYQLDTIPLNRHTIFIVYRPDTMTSGNNGVKIEIPGSHIVFPYVQSAITRGYITSLTTDGSLAFNNGILTDLPSFSRYNISVAVVTNLYQQVFRNGTPISRSTSPLNTTDVLPGTMYVQIGADSRLIDNFSGRIAEVIIYDHDLLSTQRSKVEGYLASKWGLRSLLPLNHMYRFVPPGNGHLMTIKAKYDWANINAISGTIANQLQIATIPATILVGASPNSYSLANGGFIRLHSAGFPTLTGGIQVSSCSWTSIEMWVRFRPFTYNAYLIDARPGGLTDGWIFLNNCGSAWLGAPFYYDTSSHTLNNTMTNNLWTTNEWSHIVLIYPTSLTGQFNLLSAGEGATTTMAPPCDVGEVVLYNYILDQREILALYNAKASRYGMTIMGNIDPTSIGGLILDIRGTDFINQQSPIISRVGPFAINAFNCTYDAQYKAINLNGINSHLHTPNGIPNFNSTVYTIILYYYKMGQSSHGGLLTMNRTSSNIENQLFFSDTDFLPLVYFDYTSASASVRTINSTYNPITRPGWRMMTLVRNNTTVAHYFGTRLNGMGSSTFNNTVGNSQVAIGNNFRDNNFHLNAKMCRVLMYNTALSHDQIKGIYQNLAGLYGADT